MWYYDKEMEPLLLAILKHHKLNKYLKVFNKLRKTLEKLEKKSSKLIFDIDFIDSEGLSPLHYSC